MTSDSNNIGKALEEWVNGLPRESQSEGPGVLGDWMAVVCMVDVDAAGHPVAEYYLAMKDGNLLPHVAKGLLVQADDLVGDMTQGRDDGRG